MGRGITDRKKMGDDQLYNLPSAYFHRQCNCLPSAMLSTFFNAASRCDVELDGQAGVLAVPYVDTINPHGCACIDPC